MGDYASRIHDATVFAAYPVAIAWFIALLNALIGVATFRYTGPRHEPVNGMVLLCDQSRWGPAVALGEIQPTDTRSLLVPLGEYSMANPTSTPRIIQ